jgi:hypothetical protein
VLQLFENDREEGRRKHPGRNRYRQDIRDEIIFSEPPYIGNRSDAITLLDQLIRTDYVRGINKALKALQDALIDEII